MVSDTRNTPSFHTSGDQGSSNETIQDTSRWNDAEEPMTLAQANRELVQLRRELQEARDVVAASQQIEIDPDEAKLLKMLAMYDANKKRSRTDDDEHNRNSKKLRGNPPDEYTGTNAKALAVFERSCLTYFETTGNEFTDEKIRVGWASGYVRGKPADTWWTYRTTHPGQPTWKQFMDHLRQDLGDKDNFISKSYTDWYDAKQKSNQSLREFNAYLERLVTYREEDPPSERMKLERLKGAALPFIQDAIKAQIQQPRNVEELLSCAERIESQRPKHKGKDIKDDSNDESKSRRQSNDKARRRDQQNNNGKKGKKPQVSTPELDSAAKKVREERQSKGLCYKCGEKGHFAKDCKTDNADKPKNS